MQISKFPLWICAFALCGGMTLRADDTPAQAAARAALIQKMKEVESNPPVAPQTPAPAAPAPVTPPPAAPAPVVKTPAATTAAVAPAASPTGDTEAQAQARAALNAKLAEGGTPAPAPAAIPAPAPAAPVVAAPAATNPPATTTALKPITAPALPINTSKAGKLDWLLSLYKTDQITPEQYHKQRAEILAEP